MTAGHGNRPEYLNLIEETDMYRTKTAVSSALTTLLALGLVASAQQTFAKDDGTEKCAGIVKATHNDCATSTTACHGSVESDATPEAWIYLPQGTCEKIVGGHITHQKAPGEDAAADKPSENRNGHRSSLGRKV